MPTDLTPFVPILLILAVFLGLRRDALETPWIKWAVLTGMAVLLARYLWWRFFETVLPAEGFTAQSVFVWSLFVIEMFGWFDVAISTMTLSRKVARHDEADRHEARLRASAPETLPVIDVMIATFNEPEEVLEKTVVGAVSLDWPRDRLRVWVLDDGRRPWLEAMAARLGAGYLTRADNAHAKAGNINAAIARTDGEFFLVLDADFVPARNFLYRTVGFFEDPRIGVVQVPHSFFNYDPMQTSLGLQKAMPDDQRFFFEAVMPGRDGWDCAFCCGSNGIVRRSAMATIGNRLPSGSITEDMLLTLALLRKGYITRYLNERLAVGLAPESLSAFFIQRARWARGAIQMLFLREGPLGPGLTLIQRLMFLPTHWINQSVGLIAAMITPAIYLLTGLVPFLNTSGTTLLAYQIPAILGCVLAVRLLAPRQFHPLASLTNSVLQAFRLLPTILVTLIRPHGHAFKVTPKGRSAGGGLRADRPTLLMTSAIILATAAGLAINASPDTRIIDGHALLSIVTFWAGLNMVILTMVATVAVSPPPLRTEERFDLREPARLRSASQGGDAEMRDLSLSGAALVLRAGPLRDDPKLARGDWMLVGIADVGNIPAEIMRRSTAPDGSVALGMRFHLPPGEKRNALIRRLFTCGLDNTVQEVSARAITLGMLGRIFRPTAGPVRPAAPTTPGVPPRWVLRLESQEHVRRELEVWTNDLRIEQQRARSSGTPERRAA